MSGLTVGPRPGRQSRSPRLSRLVRMFLPVLSYPEDLQVSASPRKLSVAAELTRSLQSRTHWRKVLLRRCGRKISMSIFATLVEVSNLVVSFLRCGRRQRGFGVRGSERVRLDHVLDELSVDLELRIDLLTSMNKTPACIRSSVLLTCLSRSLYPGSSARCASDRQ